LASAIKIFTVTFGLLASFLLLTPLWQRCGASEPGETKPPEQEPVHVIVVPTSGYKPAAKSKESDQGEVLFNTLNCMACHSVHNVGGDLAPMLDGVAGRRSNAYLIAHLSNAPEAQEEYQRIRGMDYASAWPHLKFTPETSRLLVAYLNTIPEPARGFVVMPHSTRFAAVPSYPENKNFRPDPKSDSSVDGEKLYDKFGCVACHSIGDVGGWLGPSLDGVGARRNRDFIMAHITDSQAHTKELSGEGEGTESEMPRFTISADGIKKITDYLMTLPRL